MFATIESGKVVLMSFGIMRDCCADLGISYWDMACAVDTNASWIQILANVGSYGLVPGS